MEENKLVKQIEARVQTGEYEDVIGLLGYTFWSCINDPCVSYEQLGKLILTASKDFSNFEKVVSVLTGKNYNGLVKKMDQLKNQYEEIDDIYETMEISEETKKEFEKLMEGN